MLLKKDGNMNMGMVLCPYTVKPRKFEFILFEILVNSNYSFDTMDSETVAYLRTIFQYYR